MNSQKFEHHPKPDDHRISGSRARARKLIASLVLMSTMLPVVGANEPPLNPRSPNVPPARVDALGRPLGPDNPGRALELRAYHIVPVEKLETSVGPPVFSEDGHWQGKVDRDQWVELAQAALPVWENVTIGELIELQRIPKRDFLEYLPQTPAQEVLHQAVAKLAEATANRRPDPFARGQYDQLLREKESWPKFGEVSNRELVEILWPYLYWNQANLVIGPNARCADSAEQPRSRFDDVAARLLLSEEQARKLRELNNSVVPAFLKAASEGKPDSLSDLIGSIAFSRPYPRTEFDVEKWELTAKNCWVVKAFDSKKTAASTRP